MRKLQENRYIRYEDLLDIYRFRLMHRPEKEKRTVVPLERVDWDMWLNGCNDDAMSLDSTAVAALV